LLNTPVIKPRLPSNMGILAQGDCVCLLAGAPTRAPHGRRRPGGPILPSGSASRKGPSLRALRPAPIGECRQKATTSLLQLGDSCVTLTAVPLSLESLPPLLLPWTNLAGQVCCSASYVRAPRKRNSCSECSRNSPRAASGRGEGS